MKKLLISSLLFTLACVVAAPAVSQAARPIRMKMTTQYMDRHVLVQKVYKPWIEEIKKRTNGRVIIQLYNPNTIIPDAEVWNGLVKDQIDIADHFCSRFPGVFPATSVTGKLPLAASNASVSSAAIWELVNTVPEMKADFKEVKLLAMHGTSPLQTFSVSKEIKTLSDMKGMKIIASGKETSVITNALGLESIIQPGPDIYMALSRNMGDGVIYPIPVTRSYKVNEAVKYMLESSLQSVPSFVAMNKARWDSLPDDIKKVFEETTGDVMVKALGAALDAGEKEDLEAMVAGGLKVNKLAPAERQHWKELIEKATKDIWMKEIEGKIAPERANEIYDQSKAVFAKYEAALSAK